MTLREAITHSGIDHPDAELLLAHVLKKDRAWLLAHAEEKLAENTEHAFSALVTRRKAHEPVAYITGEKEFYGRKFFVDRRVLIPRPATEVLIDEVKRVFSMMHVSDFQYVNILKVNRMTPADTDIVILTQVFPKKLKPNTYYLSQKSNNPPITILDIGTGSGCIGITLALEYPDVKVICTDISEGALEVAQENAKRHGVVDRVSFQKVRHASTSLFDTATEGRTRSSAQHDVVMPFLVAGNPPYIPSNTPLPADILDYEPGEALFAGPDGTDVLRPLMQQCREHPQCIGCVFECRKEQAQALLRMMR